MVEGRFFNQDLLCPKQDVLFIQFLFRVLLNDLPRVLLEVIFALAQYEFLVAVNVALNLEELFEELLVGSPVNIPQLPDFYGIEHTQIS